MYINKWALTGMCLVLSMAAVLLGSLLNTGQDVQAQQEVALYNSRYIYVGDNDSPAIFDTATGVIRKWDKYPENLVRTYTFEDPKDVIVDTISYK